MNNRALIGILCLALAAVSANGCKKAGTTLDNLKAAIVGETTASAKYAAYAQKAREEKFEAIAMLFQAASKAEAIHANKHTEVLGAMGATMDPITPQFTVKSTKENLQDAIRGESYEIDSMYPGFIRTAKDEKKDEAVTSFDRAMQVEMVHKELYTAALSALEKNDMKGLSDAYSVCTVCGNTFGADVPDACGICGVGKDKFIRIK